MFISDIQYIRKSLTFLFSILNAQNISLNYTKNYLSKSIRKVRTNDFSEKTYEKEKYLKKLFNS